MRREPDDQLQAKQAEAERKNMVQKAMAQKKILLIENELKDLESQKAGMQEEAMKKPDETFLFMSIDQKRQKLEKELEKYRDILKT